MQLSSVIDDKPVASTWLDRLRLSRGLSTTDDDDASGNPLSLDDFLRRNYHNEITGDPASDSPPSAPILSALELPEIPLDPNPGEEWYGVMSDVLSELFNFGGSSRSSTIPGKKLPRKQSNPRHCSVETLADVPLLNQKRDSNCLPGAREFATSSRSSYNKKPAPEKRERRRSVAEADGVEEEERGEKDLVGFSRSEVTVIDTSFKIWKSEKLVFRRRNVWKVRDKRGKSRVVSSKKKTMKKLKKKKKKKKRKCDVDDGENSGKCKKMKISGSVPDNNPRYQIEEVHNDPESSNANRILLRRLPSKARKEGSFASKKNSEPEARGHRSLA
ncbi:uncharacterized protein LOC18012403 [Eutrema salsugineum]|uniref:uncharacterized protein LOC18012403 n=1 Tax=Eutrema salsugineum TaxID=72664 RepID=UPI000CED669F|nr:uncharacterized protein LOC18012403 [Eutrema salsugineum]